jgi:dihydroorotate dehydrogenase electron transfer subunit
MNGHKEMAWRPEKSVVPARIAANQTIAKGVYRLDLDVENAWKSGCFPAPAPGQFVNLYLPDRSLLLPRPFSVCDMDAGLLTLVYAVVGAGTQILSACAPGVRLRVSTPNGNGFDLAAAQNRGVVTLVGGGAGVPPLLLLAKTAKRVFSLRVRAALGFRRAPFLTDAFAACCDAVYLATEDGSAGFRGHVIDLLRNGVGETADDGYFFACGPAPMLRTLARFTGGQGIPLQLSLEERMGCGYGACVGCVCKVFAESARAAFPPSGDLAPPIEMKIETRRVCRDGPVFNGNEVVWDV